MFGRAAKPGKVVLFFVELGVAPACLSLSIVKASRIKVRLGALKAESRLVLA